MSARRRLPFLLSVGALFATAFALAGPLAYADHIPYATGDVFVGSFGEDPTGSFPVVGHFDSSGNLLETLDTTASSGRGQVTGMCFDSDGNLYTTNFANGDMSKFDSQGGLLVYPWASGFSVVPESCVPDAAENIYVGEVDGDNLVRKFDLGGTQLDTFAPAVEDRGTDWIDLAADQCTLFYSSEGKTIKRFDVCADAQRPDFATLPLVDDPTEELRYHCFALRIRANSEVVIACSGAGGFPDRTHCENIVFRLNPDGSVNARYGWRGGPADCIFALNLDPDGTHVWTAGDNSGNVYRIDIETGAGAGSPLFHSGAMGMPRPEISGLAIFGEPTAALAPPTIVVDPPAAENPAGASHTLTATIASGGTPVGGVLLSFEVTAGPNVGEASDAGECSANADCTTDDSGHVSWTYASDGTVGTDTIEVCFIDAGGAERCATATKEWVNRPPSCTSVTPSSNRLWPPNHKFHLITLSGATDPDGDHVTLTITGVTQDEPVNATGDGNTSPDAQVGPGSNQVHLRAERSGRGDGRVYRISFSGSDGRGGTCTGNTTVGVPHDMGRGSTPRDSGQLFDSFGS